MKLFFLQSKILNLKSKMRRSFGLLETMIAAAIFALFAGSIIAAISVSAKNVSVNKHRLQAGNLARKAVEEITLVRDNAPSWPVTLPTSFATVTQNNVEYTYTVDYTGSTAERRDATVTVSWSDFGQTKSVTMSTYLTNWKR